MGKTRTTLAFWRGEEKRTGGENRSEKCDRQGRCQRASGMMKRRVSNGQDKDNVSILEGRGKENRRREQI